MGIKVIAFDIGGVLEVDHRGTYKSKSVHGHVAKKLDLNLDSYFDAIGRVWDKSITGEISRKEMLEVMAKHLHSTPGKISKFYKEGFETVFRSNEFLYKLARKLKDNGYRLVILSDQYYLGKDSLVKYKKLKMFEDLIISCDEGCRKPDPAIYKLTLKRMNVKPSEMVFIDNRDYNIDAAKRMGIKGVVFTENKKCVDDLKKLGVNI